MRGDRPLGLVAAIAVDSFIDGVILGAGFAAGGHTGVLLTIALAVEYLFVGRSLSATIAGSVRKRSRTWRPRNCSCRRT